MMYIIYIAQNVFFCMLLFSKQASIFVVEKLIQDCAKQLSFSSTIFLSMVTLRQPLKNKNLLRT